MISDTTVSRGHGIMNCGRESLRREVIGESGEERICLIGRERPSLHPAHLAAKPRCCIEMAMILNTSRERKLRKQKYPPNCFLSNLSNLKKCFRIRKHICNEITKCTT